jgi:DNA-binding transcriptional LysR family regulator
MGISGRRQLRDASVARCATRQQRTDLEAAALAGLGLIQAPLLGIGRYLESGALVEIIPDFHRRSLAVSLVVAHRSNLSRRVRASMKWIEDVLTPYLE